MDMLEIMHGVERALPRLLIDREGWTGVYADTEKPRLKRLWRQHRKHRINLHFFDGMEAGDKGFAHPHPWPFAVRIHEGRYLMDVGAALTAMHTQVLLVPGCEYQIKDGAVLHAIRPLDPIAKTLMVSGPPLFKEQRYRSNKVVRGLTTSERDEMLVYFAGKYPYLGDDAT